MCIFLAAAPGVIGGLTAAQAVIANVAAAASLAASIGAPIASYAAQNSAANAQQQYQQQMYTANKQIADESLLSQYADISRRQQEEQRKAAQEINAISSQAQMARATARASAIEGGVAGLSVDALMNDYWRKESQYIDSTQQQLRGTLFQLERTKEGMRSEYQGRVLSATPQPVARPSVLATGLQIAGNSASFYSDVFMNGVDRNIFRSVGR